MPTEKRLTDTLQERAWPIEGRLTGEARFEDRLVILESRRVDTLLAIPL